MPCGGVTAGVLERRRWICIPRRINVAGNGVGATDKPTIAAAGATPQPHQPQPRALPIACLTGLAMSFIIFLLIAAITYFVWRISDQLPDIIFRISEIQRDVAELKRRSDRDSD